MWMRDEPKRRQQMTFTGFIKGQNRKQKPTMGQNKTRPDKYLDCKQLQQEQTLLE